MQRIGCLIAVGLAAAAIAGCNSSSKHPGEPPASAAQVNAQWSATANNFAQKIADDDGTTVRLTDTDCTIIDAGQGKAICSFAAVVGEGYAAVRGTHYWRVTYDPQTGHVRGYEPSNG